MSNFEQLFGLEAIGAVVARDFGELGTFTGRVIKFVRGKGKGKDLYTVEYEDGDVEDMDTEEYNFAYAHHLRREEWDLEEDLEVNSEAPGDSEGQSKNWRPSKVTCNSTFNWHTFVTNGRILMVDAPFKSRDRARSNGASTILIRSLVTKLSLFEFVVF